MNYIKKNWCYSYIMNKVRFVPLAAVIINPSIPVSVHCTELHTLPVSVQRVCS